MVDAIGTGESPSIAKKSFWLFQANPDRFDVRNWWHYMLVNDQWTVGVGHREQIKSMGIGAVWVSMVDGADIWSTDSKYHGKIAADRELHATLLTDKFDYWSVFQHEREIRSGDMTAIWVAGKGDMAGIYAIADLITDPFVAPLPAQVNITYWVRRKDREELPKKPWLIAGIRYVKLVNPPWAPLISRSSVLDDEVLVDLPIFRFAQTTNLGPLSLSQWRRIVELGGLFSKT